MVNAAKQVRERERIRNIAAARATIALQSTRDDDDDNDVNDDLIDQVQF